MSRKAFSRKAQSFLERDIALLATDLNLTELPIDIITHSHKARLRSYTLLAEPMSL